MTPNSHNLSPRRNFLKTLGSLTAGMAALPSIAQAQTTAPDRPARAQYINLARGEDNFRRLVSFSSPAKGRALYAARANNLIKPLP